MNVTPYFVFVHMPKTGGSFVSAVLRDLYGKGRWHNLLLHNERLLAFSNQLTRFIKGGRLAYEEFNKHGTCHEIPDAASHLPILSCMRNPYDWYVSNYKYAWWRSNPESYPGLRADPRWPNLSFSDYLELSNTVWLHTLNPNTAVNPTLGRLTILFVNYYCHRPAEVLSLQTDDDLITAVADNILPVHFLDTANLNRELYNYLRTSGHYATETLAFILEKEKISPRNQRQSHEKWAQFYSLQQKADVRYRDRLLFHLFPQYDV